MNNLNQWENIKYFRPDSILDEWGDPAKISKELLEEMDSFREYLGVPVYVTSGFRDKKTSSQHFFGKAADVIIPNYDGHLFDLFMAASRFAFVGIGLYKDWMWRGEKIGGLHLDIRSSYERAFWFSYKTAGGRPEYVALTYDNLKVHGVI